MRTHRCSHSAHTYIPYVDALHTKVHTHSQSHSLRYTPKITRSHICTHRCTWVYTGTCLHSGTQTLTNAASHTHEDSSSQTDTCPQRETLTGTYTKMLTLMNAPSYTGTQSHTHIHGRLFPNTQYTSAISVCPLVRFVSVLTLTHWFEVMFLSAPATQLPVLVSGTVSPR